MINKTVNFKRDLVIVFLIVFIPILFFTYALIPEKSNITILGFNIDAGYFEDITAFFWSFFCQILLVSLFSIWFITCKYLWRYTLLIPIILYINNSIKVLYDRVNVDVNYLVVGIVALFFLIFVFYISNKTNYYATSLSLNKQIDEEINLLMKQVSTYKKEDYKEFKKKLITLRKQKGNLDKKEYLIQLIKLRDDYTLGKQKE
ncbi:hypothetical protein FG167_13360 [Lacinutrix sp. WUR7]|uniref:hypothetical protein n=1 Tax=Lacinutrix sp. WUR7 TaxID=2653681 RepID=UPI00193DA3BB|nr:hypothetical protein [Lacinutrix sp. WUR7]QRM90180.1 hypothetical protein FG167_13360 [Lacinutrix sp. WUR7]